MLFDSRAYVLVLACFFFNDTATTEIYTLSLHDALPICPNAAPRPGEECLGVCQDEKCWEAERSEEHTSELQSQSNLVCRLLLEKKNKQHSINYLWHHSKRNTPSTMTQSHRSPPLMTFSH